MRTWLDVVNPDTTAVTFRADVIFGVLVGVGIIVIVKLIFSNVLTRDIGDFFLIL